MPPPEGRADWPAAIAGLRGRLATTFESFLPWLERPAEVLDRRPRAGGWNAREVCTHVTLVDRYLLILAHKIAGKCRARAARGEPWPVHPPRFEHLEALARRDFAWSSPEHMLPGPEARAEAIARQLAEDEAACLALLDALPSGEGTLHRIRMSVVPGDDRLDLYQYLTIVELHARRHLGQLARMGR